jgi:NAD(P)H-dependent flavin oxidoreductase YrpB (nitropropane dioxygenase family)
VAAGAVVHSPTVLLSAEQTVRPAMIAAGSLVYAVIVSVYTAGRIHTAGAAGRSVTVDGDTRTATVGAVNRTVIGD